MAETEVLSWIHNLGEPRNAALAGLAMPAAELGTMGLGIATNSDAITGIGFSGFAPGLTTAALATLFAWGMRANASTIIKTAGKTFAGAALLGHYLYIANGDVQELDNNIGKSINQKFYAGAESLVSGHKSTGSVQPTSEYNGPSEDDDGTDQYDRETGRLSGDNEPASAHRGSVSIGNSSGGLDFGALLHNFNFKLPDIGGNACNVLAVMTGSKTSSRAVFA